MIFLFKSSSLQTNRFLKKESQSLKNGCDQKENASDEAGERQRLGSCVSL